MFMETLKGFPCLPALWLRWAKPTSANAVSYESRRNCKRE
jgi:hypothetical protein